MRRADTYMGPIGTEFSKAGSSELVRFDPIVGWFYESDYDMNARVVDCRTPSWP